MSARDRFKDVVHTLESAKASMRCRDLVLALESLGFAVRDGGKQGHKVLTHDRIPGFYSAAFTCGHGRNPEVKPAYVARICKLLHRYGSELRQVSEMSDEH
jgi:hypothetical protein